MQKRAISYVRVSSERQAQNNSLDSQKAANREYAQRNNFVIVAEIEDHETGAKLDRAGFARARQMLIDKEVEVIIVFTQDRLHRSLINTILTREELKRIGAELHYTNRGRAANTVEGVLFENIEAVFAEAERIRILERTTNGRKGKADKGLVLASGPAPYGYIYVGQGRTRVLEINDTEADIIRLIYTWYVSGDEDGIPLSCGQIADKLTMMHVPTKADNGGAGGLWKRRGHGVWERSVVARILRNSTYAGIYQNYRYRRDERGQDVRNDPKNWKQATSPVIIDMCSWQTAQRKMDQGLGQSPRNSKHEYLMGRRLKCICGYALTGKYDGPNRVFYRCNAKSSKLLRPCHVGSIQEQVIDTTVWKWFSEEATEEHIRSGFEEKREQLSREQVYTQDTLSVLQASLEDIHARLGKLEDLFLTDGISRQRYDLRRSELETVRERLQIQVQKHLNLSQGTHLTSDAIQKLVDSVNAVRERITHPELPKTYKRRTIDLLDIRATLVEQNGRRGLDIMAMWLNDPVRRWLDE